MKIVIFPWAKKLRNDQNNPKNYPYWPDLLSKLKSQGHEIIQVGVEGEEQLTDNFKKNLPLNELSQLLLETDTWIGVDSFGQHLAWDLGKRGMAIFGQSDPLIFGHKENINVLKSRDCLRDKQFWWWEQAEYRYDVWLSPDEIVEIFNEHFKQNAS